MSMEVAAKSSGNYTFRLVRVRFYGLLGIGYLTRYVRYEERLSIMPKITPVMIEVGLASRLKGTDLKYLRYIISSGLIIIYFRFSLKIPDGLPEFFWQEKKNIIHTGGSRCKE